MTNLVWKKFQKFHHFYCITIVIWDEEIINHNSIDNFPPKTLEPLILIRTSMNKKLLRIKTQEFFKRGKQTDRRFQSIDWSEFSRKKVSHINMNQLTWLNYLSELRLTTLKTANITATIPTTTYTIPAMINLYFLSKANPYIQNLDCVNNNTTTFVKVRLLEEIFLVIWWNFHLVFMEGFFHSFPDLLDDRWQSNSIYHHGESH